MDQSSNTPYYLKEAQEKKAWDAKQKTLKEKRIEVVIKKIDIPFFNLVSFLVQVAIAAVPAGIIVFIFWAIIWRIIVSN